MQTMPALALRGLTVYPKMMVHFDVGREASVKAIEESMSSNQPIFLVAQKDIRVEEPDRNHLFAMGTVSVVRQILRLPGKTIRVMVEGQTRARLHELTQTDPYLVAQVEPVETSEHYEGKTNSLRAEAAIRQAYELFDRYSELSPKNASAEMLMNIMSSEDAGYIADFLAQNVSMRVLDKQSILDELRPVQRLNKMNRLLRREVEILEMEQSIQRRVQENMTQNQKDAFLREQVRVIQEELGEDGDNELAAYRRQIADAKLPEEVETKLLKEVMHLEKQPFGSAEASVLRNYLDVCLELPWTKTSKERVNVQAARKILDADHFGLEKVKERILEFLAVKQLAPDLKGQILCLVGPPGVGKTSIGMSMARALNRKMARISLGGVHDEADIRGHRKTYVGAMPGRIINAIRQAGTRNPLLLLDEIDKLGSDMRGDPAAALLEVLDGEQNSTFRDHFVELPFDLSEVLFITTANTTSTIPKPLLDRMEVIELPSYTDEEKLQIAKQHLLPKQLKRHGLKKNQLKITDDAIREVIVSYTRESGVRVLERELGALCRKVAMGIVSQRYKQAHVTGDTLEEFLGPRKLHPEKNGLENQVGLVNGLAWTSVGGTLLEAEVNVVPGSGKVELTGNLGNVMKESARAAFTYIRSRAVQLGVEPNFYKEKDIHIHFPEGAVPKDGPSAGVTITTAMVSALTGIPVRGDVAMTGEVTLRGRVLPIGGLREKSMAALRNGIHTVIIPKDNESDLEEIDQTVRGALQFIPASHVDQVLANALEHPPLAQPAEDAGEAPLGGPGTSSQASIPRT
ncbi:MAG: endopeptidase La [Evtepia gabavorous]|uniref:endopeptidase La n=1 Tax=Evtepia gabavorous TaxID=2211183 RepID=UPI00033B7802|nr:endopeptidase La [Evtepia gabavorous]MEE0067480.1 endopeptidase La [Evtepia gabavorous]CCY27223.1 lon protease [Firmicutes bacterium CAG:114]